MAKANKAETAYVGDMPVDFLSSKNAKIKFIFAKYGYAKNKNFQYFTFFFKQHGLLCPKICHPKITDNEHKVHKPTVTTT